MTLPIRIRPTWLAMAVIAAMFSAWLIYVIGRGEVVMLGNMVDDSFYYLVPAYSFAHGEGWSLDQITRTSGFHPLFAYVAAAVSLVFGFSPAYVAAILVLSTAALMAGVWVALNLCARTYTPAIAAVAMLATLAAPRTFRIATGGLEWGFAVLMTILLTAAVAAPVPSTALVAAAAFAAALTRIDLSLFIAIFTVAITLSRWSSGDLPGRRAIVLCTAAGAAAALALVVTSANSWAITGRWVSSSILTKMFWSRSNAFQPAISWDMLMSCTGTGAAITALRSALDLRTRIVVGLGTAVTVAICVAEWRHGSIRRALPIASALAIVAYTLAYARGVNLIFDHYSAPVILPVAMLTCGGLATFGRNWGMPAAGLLLGAAFVCLTASWNGFPAHFVIARRAPDLIAHAEPESRVAGWNVGVASWRSGRRIVNLDGLANADVVDSLTSGTLACYLRDTQIDYLMDFGYMFAGEIDTGFSGNEEERRLMLVQRNGYDPKVLFRCVEIAAEAPDAPRSTYRLFRLDRSCVAAICERERLRNR
jgi:hypothetical protein